MNEATGSNAAPQANSRVIPFAEVTLATAGLLLTYLLALAAQEGVDGYFAICAAFWAYFTFSTVRVLRDRTACHRVNAYMDGMAGWLSMVLTVGISAALIAYIEIVIGRASV